MEIKLSVSLFESELHGGLVTLGASSGSSWLARSRWNCVSVMQERIRVWLFSFSYVDGREHRSTWQAAPRFHNHLQILPALPTPNPLSGHATPSQITFLIFPLYYRYQSPH